MPCSQLISGEHRRLEQPAGLQRPHQRQHLHAQDKNGLRPKFWRNRFDALDQSAGLLFACAVKQHPAGCSGSVAPAGCRSAAHPTMTAKEQPGPARSRAQIDLAGQHIQRINLKGNKGDDDPGANAPGRNGRCSGSAQASPTPDHKRYSRGEILVQVLQLDI
jgi:hypothetical protein